MLIKGEKEKIELTVDSKEKAEIMKKLMEMEGVKSIEPENSHIKVDSLSKDVDAFEGQKVQKGLTSSDEEYDPPSKEDKTTFEAPDSGADVPEDGF